MKKIKPLMLMIVLLLSNFIALAQNRNEPTTSTGEQIYADTTVTVIPVHLLKLANAKMIERKYLIEINNEQDSIINLQNKEINLINNQKDKFVNAYYGERDINKKLREELNNVKRKNKVTVSALGSVIATLAVLFIVK